MDLLRALRSDIETEAHPAPAPELHLHETGRPSLPPGTIRVEQFGIFVSCGHGSLFLESVQLEGRKRVTAREFVNGARLTPGEKFD